MLLVVTDHARRRQFVLNALLRRSTDARLERLAHEQLVEKRKDRELLMAMTFHEVRHTYYGHAYYGPTYYGPTYYGSTHCGDDLPIGA